MSHSHHGQSQAANVQVPECTLVEMLTVLLQAGHPSPGEGMAWPYYPPDFHLPYDFRPRLPHL